MLLTSPLNYCSDYLSKWDSFQKCKGCCFVSGSSRPVPATALHFDVPRWSIGGDLWSSGIMRLGLYQMTNTPGPALRPALCWYENRALSVCGCAQLVLTCLLVVDNKWTALGKCLKPKHFLSNSLHISALRARSWVCVWAEKKSRVFAPSLLCFPVKNSQGCPPCNQNSKHHTKHYTSQSAAGVHIPRLRVHELR